MPNYQAITRQIASRYGLGDWFVNQIRQESGFNPNAKSGAGAQGIAQIVPHWHPDAPGMDDPVGQLNWAAKYMSGLVNQHGGNVAQALSVYNSGRPDAYLDPNFAGGQTYNYVKSILGGSSGRQASPLPLPSSPSLPGMSGSGLGGSAPSLSPSALSPPLPQNPLSNPLSVPNMVAFGGLGQDPSQALSNLTMAVAMQPPPGMSGQMPQATTYSLPTPNTVGVQVDHSKDVSPNAGAVIRLADHYLGTPYQWGGANPKTGFDCSGFVQWLYGKAGVNLPRTTYQQIKVGQPVSRQNLRPGDIVFFSDQGDVHHEGLYIGDNQFIHAPHTGDVVRISSLSEPYYASQFAGGRRVISR